MVVASAVALISLSSGATTWTPSPKDRLQLILAAPPSLSQRHGPFTMLESDGFETSNNVVASLHSLGKRAVCYIDAGTWESWRPDASKFPKSVLGRSDAGWPGEKWLDIRQQSVLIPIIRARFAMCVKKGFDAVDPDNVNGVSNATGFPLTMKEQLSYDREIAALAHSMHLKVALKSFAEGAVALQPSFDFVVDEQCVAYHECSSFSTFVVNHKPVFDIEYTSSLSFCAALPASVRGMAKHLSLDGWVRWCP